MLMLKRILKKIIYSIINGIGLIAYDRKYVNKDYFETYKDLGSKWIAKGLFFQKLCGFNKNSPWPVCHKQTIVNPTLITFDPKDVYIFQNPGIYIQANGRLTIGSGTFIGPNVGIITANHDLNDLHKHQEVKPIYIGCQCWIGMNSVILPGVSLGPKTIVGAGSVVTKSFEEGNCIIAGNPAIKIRDLG